MPHETMTPRGLYQLLSWMSPGFPIGAYAYSHGIEFAVENGQVTDEETLRHWIEGVLMYGTGLSSWSEHGGTGTVAGARGAR